MNSVILFRDLGGNHEEYAIAAKYFPTYKYRALVPPQSLVFGRYSTLPFYRELQADLAFNKSSLVNSLDEHRFITDCEWIENVKEYTPRTYFNLVDARRNWNGPMIVKGMVTSRKYDWNNSFYAATKEDLHRITSILNADYYIGREQLIYREFVNLRTYEIGIAGERFSNEWRFFCYKNQIVCYGPYWVIAEDSTIDKCRADFTADKTNVLEYAQFLANALSENVTAFVMDIAQKDDGSWILIEVNDLQQSGLQGCDADEFYGNLSKMLTT